MSIKAKDEYCTQCTQMHPVYLDGCPNVKPSALERGITITTANETDEDAALKYVEMPDWETLAEGNVTEMEVVEGFIAGAKFKEEQQLQQFLSDKVNYLLANAMRHLSQEERITLRDKLSRRLPEDKCETFTPEQVKNALHKAELEHGKNYTEIWNTLSKNLKK